MSIFQSLWYEKIRQIVLWREKLEYLSKPLINIFLLCYVMLCYVMLCYVMLCYVMLFFQFQTTKYMSRIGTSNTLPLTTFHLMVSCAVVMDPTVCCFVVDFLKPTKWATPNKNFFADRSHPYIIGSIHIKRMQSWSKLAICQCQCYILFIHY